MLRGAPTTSTKAELLYRWWDAPPPARRSMCQASVSAAICGMGGAPCEVRSADAPCPHFQNQVSGSSTRRDLFRLVLQGRAWRLLLLQRLRRGDVTAQHRQHPLGEPAHVRI